MGLEIRPSWEPEDFDPEIARQVNALREKISEAEVKYLALMLHAKAVQRWLPTLPRGLRSDRLAA